MSGSDPYARGSHHKAFEELAERSPPFKDSNYDRIPYQSVSPVAIETVDSSATGNQYLEELFKETLAIVRERASNRGATQERVMDKVIGLFNEAYGLDLPESAGWMFMNFLKIVRGIEGKHTRDDSLDHVAYAALYEEARNNEADQSS